jgi:adenine nucleotide transporter 17
MEELFSYHNLIHALAGATGGATAISVFFPLNSVRLRLQVDEEMKSKSALQCMKDIYAQEGLPGLYQGWWSSIVSLGFSNFVYFYAYNGLKKVFENELKRRGKKPDIGALTNLLIASTAGVINVLTTTPLWVAGTRLMVQKKRGSSSGENYTGVWNCLTRIVSEEGIHALWKGVGPSLILVSNPSIQVRLIHSNAIHYIYMSACVCVCYIISYA